MHELKVWPRFYRLLANGRKTWEFREEKGKPFWVGESLILNEVGEKGGEPSGRQLRARVTYVLRGWPIPPGWACMSVVVAAQECRCAGRAVTDAELNDAVRKDMNRVSGS